jgi:hypothetical protein
MGRVGDHKRVKYEPRAACNSDRAPLAQPGRGHDRSVYATAAAHF